MASLLDEIIMELAPTFPEMFSMFCSEYLADFRDAPRDMRGISEHKLEWTAAYEAYLAMFEGALEDFLASKGADAAEFYEQAQNARECGTEHTFFIDILLSCIEYERFYEMMVSECRRQEADSASSKDSAK